MDEFKNHRAYMRGETKNARAEELLAVIKAEREVEEIEKRQVPNRIKKCPVLPAIRAVQETGYERPGYFNTRDMVSQNIALHNKSRFIWRNMDETKDESRKRMTNDSVTRTARDYIMNETYEEVPHKNLPPLKTTKHYSMEELERPSCPEPPPSPPHKISSHST